MSLTLSALPATPPSSVPSTAGSSSSSTSTNSSSGSSTSSQNTSPQPSGRATSQGPTTESDDAGTYGPNQGNSSQSTSPQTSSSQTTPPPSSSSGSSESSSGGAPAQQTSSAPSSTGSVASSPAPAAPQAATVAGSGEAADRIRAEASQLRIADTAVLDQLSSLIAAASNGNSAPVLLQRPAISQNATASGAPSGAASAGLDTVLDAYREQATAKAA